MFAEAFRISVWLGLIAIVTVFAVRAPFAATDTIGIASELTSLRWAIDDAHDRLDRAEQFDDFRSSKLHYSIRDVRKALNSLGKRLRRAERSGAALQGVEGDIENLAKFIEEFRDLNSELESAKGEEDTRAARRSLAKMSRKLKPMETRIFGLGSLVGNENSDRPRRPETTSRSGAVTDRDQSSLDQSATAVTGHPGKPDFVVSKIDFWRRSGLLGGKFLGIYPYVKNLSAGQTENPIRVEINYDKPRACRLQGGIGPHQELRTKEPCAYLPEDTRGPSKQMKFRVILDAGGMATEGRVDNNVCTVTYTPTRADEGTFPCVRGGT